jgi:poly(3-hydroxyalkanoate) synthetase
MVSWRNITPETAHFCWDDYLELGVLKAIDVASDIAARRDVNLLGLCGQQLPQGPHAAGFRPAALERG